MWYILLLLFSQSEFVLFFFSSSGYNKLISFLLVMWSSATNNQLINFVIIVKNCLVFFSSSDFLFHWKERLKNMLKKSFRVNLSCKKLFIKILIQNFELYGPLSKWSVQLSNLNLLRQKSITTMTEYDWSLNFLLLFHFL